MFKNVFQGGPCVEVFSSQGKEPLAKWKLMGAASIHKVYEKEAKSYVHVLEGATTTTKIQLPKDTKQTMVLIQRYLILQLFVPLGKDFSIELSVSDMSNNKRRLLFSTAQRDISATPLHAKIPLTILKRAMWLNLCIDMVSIVGEAFRGQTYKSLDTLTISAACHLRKVFTMKSQLSDNTDDDDLYECKPSTNDNEIDSLPRSMQFANDVSCMTQVLNMNKLKHAELKLRGENSRPPSSTETDLNSSMRAKQDSGKPMHIAFGSKVPMPSTASDKRITSSTGSREGSSSGNRTSRSSHSRTQRNEDPMPSARGNRSARGEPDTLVVHGHMRQKSDPGTEIVSDPDLDKGTLSGSKTWSPGTGGIAEEIKPHPPRQKSGDKSRRPIKVRPSSGKEREGSGDPRSRSNSCSTRRGTYDRTRYSSSTQDPLASEESSDADAMQNAARRSDAVILKSAAAKIRTDSFSDEDRPTFEESSVLATSEKQSRNSARTKPESYSESDDVLAQSRGKNVLSSGRGKVQRRKKKPERGRMDSLSETEEVQTIRTGRTVNGRDGRSGGSKAAGSMSSRGSGKGDRKVNGADGGGDIKNGHSGSRISDRLPSSNGRQDNPRLDEKQSYKDEDTEEDGDDDNPHPQKQKGKMYMFMSPPRNAPVRMVERSRQLDTKKLQMQLEKISLASQDPDFARSSGSVENEMPSNDRGAELEADFLQGNVSADEEPLEGREEKLLKSKDRYRAIIARSPSPRLKPRSPRPGERSPVPPGSPVPRAKRSTDNNSSSKSASSTTDQGPAPARGSSPTLRRSKLKGSKLSVDRSLLMSSPRAMSRCSVSSKRLKEIAKDDPRLSISDEYDWRKYQSNNSSLASSMEANMLASLRRQQLEEMLDEEPAHETNSSFDIHNYGDDDLSSSSSDDTVATFGTFKQPDSSKKLQRYQDEMHFPTNGNPLLQSNPRDWGEPFSPPIVLPSERIREEGDGSGMFLDQQSPNKEGAPGFSDFGRHKSSSSEEHASRLTESDGVHDEDELDLLYDPCLNCYFDPKTGKYYELK